AVDREVDLLALWRRDAFAAFRRPWSRLDRIARLATQRVRLPLLYCDEEIIYRVVQLKQREIRLQSEPQICWRGIKDIIRRDRRFGGPVECDNLGPLKSDHVDRQLLSWRSPLRFLPEKVFQPVAQITQSVGIGRIACQIRGDQFKELPFPDNRA